MLKVLDKGKKYIIVKMDIQTFQEIEKKPSLHDLVKEAENSDKVFHTHEELMADLMS
ncbi:MAG: hypothetical protein PHE25_02900 [Candidatus Gracilibacteria bacterium]|nr:hypothetical protein [Candidatus Gracilibacteria bacterium]